MTLGAVADYSNYRYTLFVASAVLGAITSMSFIFISDPELCVRA